jgi:hypothetical protein
LAYCAFEPLVRSVLDPARPQVPVRVIDVKTERNTATGQLLDDTSDIANSLGDLVPSASIPGINLAIKTARLIHAQVASPAPSAYRASIQLLKAPGY